mmetsp:Transcript_1437/g.4226  ORF Transcript_1437/g.4226 Transcript_1437/m.4226 type:complete len:321 (-) Transcript_1437:52-1014(-)
MAGPRLAESSLYREDVLVSGHSAVWGSLWEPGPDRTGRWGYACCRGFERSASCPNSAVAAAASAATADTREGEGGQGQGGDVGEGASPALDLMSRDAFDGSPGSFVEYAVGWLLREWRSRLSNRDPQLLADPLFCQAAELERVEAGLRPLLRTLPRWDARRRRGSYSCKPKVLTERDDWECPHCSYKNNGERVACRKCKRPDEHYVEPDEFPQLEQVILEQVEKLVALTAAQEYIAAAEAFLEITLGRVRWRSDVMGLTGGPEAPSRKARAAQGHMQRQNAALAPLDLPEVQTYLHSLKRLITLAQTLRPNADASKNVVR